jgi:hypothetical protein
MMAALLITRVKKSTPVWVVVLMCGVVLMCSTTTAHAEAGTKYNFGLFGGNDHCPCIDLRERGVAAAPPVTGAGGAAASHQKPTWPSLCRDETCSEMNETHTYYGLGCLQHDLQDTHGLTPECNATDPPAWCKDRFCWVDSEVRGAPPPI